MLAPWAARLDTAATRAEAEAHLATPCDLIVTDLNLEGSVAGWALAKAALERWPGARALVVSGHLPAADPLRPEAGPRAATLAKPLTADRLGTSLEGLAKAPPSLTESPR